MENERLQKIEDDSFSVFLVTLRPGIKYFEVVKMGGDSLLMLNLVGQPALCPLNFAYFLPPMNLISIYCISSLSMFSEVLCQNGSRLQLLGKRVANETYNGFGYGSTVSQTCP